MMTTFNRGFGLTEHYPEKSMTKTDTFPARVHRSGHSKVVTIPEAIRDRYEIGDVVEVKIQKKS
jgi:hypothetical protein